MRRPIYNLKFPYYCNELTIFQYQFTRVPDYAEKLNLKYILIILNLF